MSDLDSVEFGCWIGGVAAVFAAAVLVVIGQSYWAASFAVAGALNLFAALLLFATRHE